VISHKGRPIWTIGEELVPILCSLLGFTVFCLVFVTYNHARYMLPQFFFLALFSVLVISQTGNWMKGKVAGLSILILLMGIQSFTSIDIVTEKLSGFASIDTGDGVVLSTNWIASPDNLGDPIVYNRQYSYLDETLRRVFQLIEPTENTKILLPSPYRGQNSYGYHEEYIFFNLLGDYKYSYCDVFWNEEKNELILGGTDNGELVSFLLLNEDTPEKLQAENELYYLSLPWVEDDMELLEDYTVLDEETIAYRGWKIIVKHLAYAPKEG
jgi:hypothetical protein